MNLDSLSSRKGIILSLFICFSYVVTLTLILKDGQFSDKPTVVLILNTGSNMQESGLSLESRQDNRNTSSSDQRKGNLQSSDQQNTEIESSGVNSRSRNLLPPSQHWALSQIRKAMSLLDSEFPSNNEWRECGGRTYFFPKINTIFTGVPKTGCTNWVAALLRAEGKMTAELEPGTNLNWVHRKISLDYRMNHLPEHYTNSDLQKAFSFAVVRNPWTRLVSGFRDKLSSEKTQGPSLLNIRMWIVRQMRGIKDSKLLYELYPTFDEYARWLIHRKGTINGHFQPQVDQLCIRHAMYDFIVPLEHSGSLSQEIMSKINASDMSLLGSYDKSEDPRHQKSTLYARKWLSELDQDVIEQLYSIYKADFALLNYSNFTHPDFPLPLHTS